MKILNSHSTNENTIIGQVHLQIGEDRQLKQLFHPIINVYMAVEQSKSPIMITDKRGIIQYANKAFIAVSGYSYEELIGANPSLLKSGAHPKEFYQDLWKTILSGNAWQSEICNKNKKGKLYWEYQSISPIKDSLGQITGFLGIRLDDSKRKAYEYQIKQLMENLQKKNIDIKNYAKAMEAANKQLKKFSSQLRTKYEEMLHFLHTISHDFQAPLRKISIFSDCLEEEEKKKLGKKGVDYLMRLRSSVSRLSDLMNGLIIYNQIGSPEKRHMSPISLNIIVQDVIQDLEIDFQENKGRCEVEDLATIQASPFELRGLFQNLIANSLKYSKPNVSPVIKISGQESPARNGYYEICIEDNGIGFEDKYAARIFKPFERLHRNGEYEGIGMGLTICKKIVERLGGEIDVKSKVNEGTTFIITLQTNQPTDEMIG